MQFKFSFKCNNETYGPVNYSTDDDMLIINDSLIEDLYDELDNSSDFDLSSVNYFDMVFDANISIIKVMDVSYSFKMMFYGSKKNVVDWFDVKCENISINNYDIGRLNIRGGQLEVFNSTVKSIMFGKNLSVGPFDEYTQEFSTSIVIDNTTIGFLGVEMDLETFKVSRCKVESCAINSIVENGLINHFEISNFSYFKRIYLNGQINTYHIDASEFDAVLAKDGLKIGEYKETFSTISKVKDFKKDMFIKKSRETWNLIKMSAEVDHNLSLRAEALYNIHELEFDEHKPAFKWIFKNTMGYGYKPIRLIRTILLTVICFGLLYSIIDGIEYLKSGGVINNTLIGWKLLFEKIADNMYYSGITLTTTGYSDKIHPGLVSKLFAVFEAMIGVSLLSLFIFSLTKRYLEK